MGTYCLFAEGVNEGGQNIQGAIAVAWVSGIKGGVRKAVMQMEKVL